MKFSKNWKRFFTLDRHHAAGFTLVELIVVIAILAILAGVAVPAYSGYIKKANMSADQSLVSEVAHALSLQYYADPDNAVADYVVLSTSGALAGGDLATDAMEAAFGSNWEDAATLKYDGWTDYVGNTITDTNIANSSYVKHTTPSAMMGTVSNLTDALSGLAGSASQDPLSTLSRIGQLSDEQAAAIRQDIKDSYGLEYGDEGYDTVLANSLVKYVIDDLGNGTSEEVESSLSMLASTYATIYAWSLNSEEGARILAEINDAIEDPESDSNDIVAAVYGAFDTAQGSADFQAYGEGQGAMDYAAVFGIMGAASQVTNGMDMSQEGLYSSDAFGNKLDSYISAVTAVGGMSNPPVVGNGDILVFMNADGTILTQYAG